MTEPSDHSKSLSILEIEQLISSTIADVARVALEISEEPFRGAKRVFPQAWCEHFSIAVARVLEARGLSNVTYVVRGLADDLSGHAWLEYRYPPDAAALVIDATLSQFSWAKGDHLDRSPTPAAESYTEVRYEGPWNAWPAIRSNRSFVEYSDRVLERLGLAAPDSGGVAAEPNLE